MNRGTFPLSALPVGGQARVASLCTDEGMRRRLLDLGLVTGTPVTCLYHCPAGDPTAYLIRGAVIALRRRDSADILMKKEPAIWG